MSRPVPKGSYERGRYFECNLTRSKTFDEILPNEVTLQHPSAMLEVFGTGSCNITPFKEVGIVPYWQVAPQPLKDFIDQWKGVVPHARELVAPLTTTARGYSKRLLEAVKEALYNQWNPHKFHVVTHSSGYDTRLISVALKQLYDELGDSWLGKTVFLEADGEAVGSKQLLDIEGWGSFPFIVYNSQETDVHEYHAQSIDFENAWTKFESAAGFPLNVWWDPILWSQEEGLIPGDDKIQCVSGFGSNEIALGYNTFRGLKWYVEWIYHHPLSIFKTKGEWIYPYWDLGVWDTLQRARIWRYRNCGIAKHAIAYVAPQTLCVKGAAVKDREPTVRLLSPRLIDQASKAYKNSSYGKTIHMRTMGYDTVPRLMDYNEFWGSFVLASLCEQLKSRGIMIQTESGRKL